ncbi:MAG: type II secretion system F family protein [Oscillospiraceae bacterium]|nr:type II secretion system F family protein [Oscillospiraceae bacterium]
MADTAKALTPSETAAFCSQVTLLLRAGIPLYEGISLLLEDAEDERTRSILRVMTEKLDENAPLYLALRATGVFPDYMVSMAEIGAASGRLEEVMSSLSAYYEREQAMQARIRSAVAYPVLLFAMMSAVVILLAAKVLPMFRQVLEQLGGEMPAAAGAVMQVGMSAGTVLAWVLPGLLVLILLGALWGKTAPGKAFFGRLAATSVFTRKIASKSAAGRFASAMSLMLASGMDTDAALEMVPAVLENPYLGRKVEECRRMMKEGSSFSEAVAKAGIFPALFARMLTVGVKTGATDTVLAKLAGLYEDELEEALDRAVSLVEPLLIAVLSVVVGVILISVMLPLVGVMSSIG